MKPEIYGSEPDSMEFLTEHELSFLRVPDEELKGHILQRAKMFSTLHRAWQEYDSKGNMLRRLTREEWKKKAYQILALQFKLSAAQGKGVIDSYWRKVSLPKGGLAK